MKTALHFRSMFGIVVQSVPTASSGEAALPFTSLYPRDFICPAPAILQHQLPADSCFTATFALVWIQPGGLRDLHV